MATNRDQADSDNLSVAIASKLSGDPAIVGVIPGVCLTDTDADGVVTLETKGVFRLSVKGVDGGGNSAVAVGDQLYYTEGDTPKINKKTTGTPFGVALAAVVSGATTTIRVALGKTG